MAVIILHGSYRRFPGGFLGVEVFFVLSGYLITALLADEIAASGRLSLRAFYMRRILRLGPALLIGIIAANILGTFSPHLQWPTFSLPLADLATLSYFGNWVEFWSPGRLGLLSHTWSLAVEEQFYIFWPIVFAVGYLRVREQIWQGIALTAAGFALATAVTVLVLHTPAGHVYFATFTHLPALLGGAALALYLRSGKEWIFGSRAVAAVATLFLVSMALRADSHSAVMYVGGFWLVDLACIYLIGHVIVANTIFRRLLGLGPLVGLGRISYGLYLYHFPIFLYAEQFRVAHSPLNFVVVVGIALIASVVLATLSFELIERPILRLKVGIADADRRRRLERSVRE